MESRRFDALTRALSTPGSRRCALAALVGSALGFLTLAPGPVEETEARKHHKRKRRHDGEARIEGPCGNGGGKANRCRKNRHCCTGYCDKRKTRRKKGKKRKVQGRCRCRKAGHSCTADRNCCPERTGRTCVEGVCRALACIAPGGACPAEVPCCAGLHCDEGGACQPCGDVCAEGCPFSSIQEAINAVDEGAIIRLCAETYRGTIAIGKDVTLQGVGDEENDTVLDGLGQGSVIHMTDTSTVVLEGLRITNGGNTNSGGGVFNDFGSTTTLTGCTVTNSKGGAGAGLYNTGNLTLSACTVSHNEATSGGGGIFSSNRVELTDCTVIDNKAAVGGGMYNDPGDDATLTDTTVTLNEATITGGGIFNGQRGTVTLAGASSVADNTNGNCGGVGDYTDPNGACAP